MSLLNIFLQSPQSLRTEHLLSQMKETEPKWFAQALQGPEHRTPCLMPEASWTANGGVCAIVVCGESPDTGSSVDLSSWDVVKETSTPLIIVHVKTHCLYLYLYLYLYLHPYLIIYLSSIYLSSTYQVSFPLFIFI